MPALDPETFEEEKYREFLPKLQTAYKRAFDRLNDEYDSSLVHAIDQQVLNESEPSYEGDGEFVLDLPADPLDRLDGVVVADERAQAVLDRYVTEVEAQLAAVFDVDGSEPKA
mgnify:CR=1 FL=1